MKDLAPYIETLDSDSLVVFDIDMVLLQPGEPAFQYPNLIRYQDIYKSFKKSLSADHFEAALNLILTDFDAILVDPLTPTFIKKLAHKGIKAIALSNALPGSFGPIPNMEQWRVEKLKSFGIDFSYSFPDLDSLVLDSLTDHNGRSPAYQNGVIHAGGESNPEDVGKGPVLLSFLNEIRWMPNILVFIDDKEKHVKNVEKTLKKEAPDLHFIGVVFEGAKLYPSKYVDAGTFKEKFEYLANQARSIPLEIKN